MSRPLLLLFALALGLVACGSETLETTPAVEPTVDAYDLAGEVELEPRASQDWVDLHNVFRLSDAIVSGGEPHGEDAIRRIAEMGVKTIVSVDGKTPDQETAAAYGMRYVHVPIQYKGITPDERLRLAKTFRELEGPFFVHCFHGKHRGPAAAALGRVVLDGAPREEAVAEMRQYCGTSEKYGGLYETIARGVMPTEEQTRAFSWTFPAAHAFEGFRGLMVAATRAHDHLKLTAKRGFRPDPEHPDLNAQSEAARLAELFQASLNLDETQKQPEEYRAWLQESADHARALVQRIGELQTHEAEGLLADAMAELQAVTQRCDSCHKVYRNN